MANRRCRKIDAALLIGFCVLASIISLDLLRNDEATPSSSSLKFRRYLKDEGRRRRRRRARRRTSTPSVYSWASNYLRPVTETPEPSKETVLFWHIPKSGGTTAKAIYECLDQTIASRAGALPKFGHDHDEDLLAYHPWKRRGHLGPTYVNVDTTSPAGIIRSEELGLVPSGLADMIFTSFPAMAIEHLYDDSHKGRVLALFRHPVERLVSKFYYLQIATWERTYHPSWKKISVLEFAQKRNNDNNFMVKKLAGKKMYEKVTEEDFRMAVGTLDQRFIVGLMDQMEESIHRFNIVMGIDESDEAKKECMDEFFGHGVEKKNNSHPHPKVREGSAEWKAFAERNDLDIRLYDHILHLFDQQKEIIDSYAKSMAVEEE